MEFLKLNVSPLYAVQEPIRNGIFVSYHTKDFEIPRSPFTNPLISTLVQSRSL